VTIDFFTIIISNPFSLLAIKNPTVDALITHALLHRSHRSSRISRQRTPCSTAVSCFITMFNGQKMH